MRPGAAGASRPEELSDHRLPRNRDCAGMSTLASPFDEKDMPRRMFTFQARLTRSSRVSSCWDELKALCALLFAGLALLPTGVVSARAGPRAVKGGVIHEAHSRETIRLLASPPTDDFVAAPRMGMDDNNRTGRFLDQSFSVADAKLTPGDDPM